MKLCQEYVHSMVPCDRVRISPCTHACKIVFVYVKFCIYIPTAPNVFPLWAISKKMALFWDILSTQKAKFQIWYLSEFLVVLWPKYVVINKTTLGIHKNGQIKIFVKIPIGLCAQI